jgi:tRNA-specific 2-thiouridylase
MGKSGLTVLALMSGGVDSSVAAALLKEQGYNVSGVTMKIWDGKTTAQGSTQHGCYGPGEQEDIEDARKVALNLNIPFHVFDLTREYQSGVLDYFCSEYLSGRTPNPCVRCNPSIKFGALVDKARLSGIEFDFIASGHYAKVAYDDTLRRYLLKKAKDLIKDQTYFLAFLSQQQLSRLMLPLGDYTKIEIREMAKRLGLQVASKPDSQNFVCGDYTSVINAESNPGPILDNNGNVMGQHRGLQFYTIGQRKGLEISAKIPLYVSALDPARNTVTLGTKEDLYLNEFIVSGLNWIAISELQQTMIANVKIRSSHREAEAILTPVGNGNVKLKFKECQFAITPGQAAVFYQDDVVIGGGIIKNIVLSN